MSEIGWAPNIDDRLWMSWSTEPILGSLGQAVKLCNGSNNDFFCNIGHSIVGSPIFDTKSIGERSPEEKRELETRDQNGSTPQPGSESDIQKKISQNNSQSLNGDDDILTLEVLQGSSLESSKK